MVWLHLNKDDPEGTVKCDRRKRDGKKILKGELQWPFPAQQRHLIRWAVIIAVTCAAPLTLKY